MLKVIVLAILVSVASTACDNTERCRAIGETRVISLQPDDRLYYEKHCKEYEAKRLDAFLAPMRDEEARKLGFANAAEMDEQDRRDATVEASVKPKMSRECYDAGVLLRTKECRVEFQRVRKALNL